jgi:1,4-alpha-glucan branching enzyme
MPKKQYLKSKPLCKVTFELPSKIKAKSASLVGEFNNWNPEAAPMKRLKSGAWKITMELEKNREYQYRYLVNGQEWHNDADADKYLPNQIDGDNSVVVI